MRYFIIFGVTALLVLIILFFNPFLGTYSKTVSFDFSKNQEGCKWNYIIKGDSLKYDQSKKNIFKFKASKNGKGTIIFTCSDAEEVKHEVDYKFKVFAKQIFWVESNGKGLYNYPNPY